MSGKTILGVAVTLIGVVGLILLTTNEKGKEKDGKQNTIHVDAVIEAVDVSANTVTARSTLYVIPPHDNVGGAVFEAGSTDSHKDNATKYVRLPVMPQTELVEKKPQVGQRVILRLELLQQGSHVALVVTGIEEFTGVERIGVDWLDAPGTNGGN